MRNKTIFLIFPISFMFSGAVLSDDLKENVVSPEDEILHLEAMTVSGESSPLGSAANETIDSEDILRKQSQVSDTAKLLEDTAGISLQTGGGVSSLPIIRGLNDTRVKVDVNGMTVNSICPNHMNPALASIDRSNIGSITIIKGITPVSMGGDSIAGTISVESAKPVFAEPEEDILLTGSLSSFYRSNGDAFGGSIAAGIANEHIRLDYSGSDTQSNNYEDGNGDVVKSTSYENQNHAAALSFLYDSHLLEIKGGQQHIPFQGFPGARMDLTNNDSIFGNVHYNGLFDWGSLDTRLYLENTSHTMDYGSDRESRQIKMPMETRGKNFGYKWQVELPFNNEEDLVRLGNEFHSTEIDDFWPATSTRVSMMGPNNFINLNDAERDRVGFFAEWERNWSNQWKTHLGLRYDHTMTDTGDVQGYNNIILNPVTDYYEQAQAFNALDHERNFDTFDATALIEYIPADWSKYTFGYARKNRAPSLHELYPWSTNPMAMTMIGWFNDGNGYVGNMNLDPETAHNIAFTADFSDPENDSWNLQVSPFFSYVEDYIDADPCKTCRQSQPNNGYYYLQTANHNAYLWGVDVTGHMELLNNPDYGEFSTETIMSYVRGKRTDGDNLYHMMPFNLKWRVNHKLKGWRNTIEMQFVDTKDDVQRTRNELETSSYILLNVKTGYQWKNISIDAGVDNILDKQYYYPLSGVYIGDQNAMTLLQSRPKTQNLPGQGRSVFVGLTISY